MNKKFQICFLLVCLARSFSSADIFNLFHQHYVKIIKISRHQYHRYQLYIFLILIISAKPTNSADIKTARTDKLNIEHRIH